MYNFEMIFGVAMFFVGFIAGAVIFVFWKNKKTAVIMEAREKEIKIQSEKQLQLSKTNIERGGNEINRRMYELAILKELGERVGYSLNIQNIVDIITGSLHQFIEYSAASYMLLGGERIIFKVHLEKSVSRSFVNEIEDRMLKSLSALLDREFKKSQVEELLSGAILLEDIDVLVGSFFNIPLIIGEKVVGVLTVAHSEKGLYKEEEMTILYKITHQASQAVTRLQEVVQTEQRKVNSMVESMTEGVIMTDQDYRLLVVNPAAKRILGLTAKNDITIFDIIDVLGGKFDIRGKLEESVRLGKTLAAQDVVVLDKFYQILVAPVRSVVGIKGEETLGGVVILHDITKEKELERLREDFISMMVHELRSPLSNVMKILELLGDGTLKPGDKDYVEMTQMVSKNTRGMLDLINDLLDAAKLEAGKFEIHRQPTNIKEIIQDKVHFYELVAKEAKLTLKTAVDGLLEVISVDPIRIAQVFNNFISNALKFTKPGGTVTIQALIHRKGQNLDQEAKQAQIEWLIHGDDKNIQNLPDSLIIAVTDTGIGISPENIPLLFNKFKQFQSRVLKVEQKGTGLGLAIAKGIIEAHNGTIGAASEEGIGSTFYGAMAFVPEKNQPQVNIQQ